MVLKVLLDDQLITLKLEPDFLQQATDFFARMDKDMDAGWQMAREWVPSPNREQRIRVAAEKLLTALENENEQLGRMMAGYIMTRMPQLESIEMDPSGEMMHRLVLRKDSPIGEDESQGVNFSHQDLPRGLSKMEAMAQAGKDVSRVFKVGRHYRFSVYNHATGGWDDSPSLGDKDEAESLREQVFKQRLDAMTGQSV